MERMKFRQLIAYWADNVSKVRRYVFSNPGRKTSAERVLELYPQIKTMWQEHRCAFRSKGNYKEVRRAYLRSVAQLFDRQHCLWSSMPADLCKEILHKLDQKWISLYYISDTFMNYLCWKASLLGYNKRPIKYPCYVDEKLKIVYNFSEAVGIANYSMDKVEILFFKPLKSQNVVKSEALKNIEIWGKQAYPQYFACLPKYRTCKLANIFNQSENHEGLLIKDCHLADIEAYPSFHAPQSTVALDKYGELSFTGKKSRTQNIYAAIRINFEQFYSLNSRAGFPCHYIFYEK